MKARLNGVCRNFGKHQEERKQMKKKLLFGLLSIVLVALPFIGACGEKTPEVFELTFTTIMPSQAPITQTFVAWGDRIKEETGGRVNITFYLGGSLMSHEEELRGVQDGLADIAWYTPSEDAGVWDLVTFYDLAFLNFKSNWQATDIYTEMMENDDLGLMDEFESKGIKPYCWMFPPPFQLFTTDKAVRTPADISGMKVYALGEMSDVFAAAGAAPIEMEITEVQGSLDRGLITGVCTHDAAMLVFGLLDYQKYATRFGEGGCYEFMNLFIINADVWDSFPNDIKQVFNDLQPWLLEEEMNASQSEADMAVSILHDANATFLELTSAEMAEWVALAEESHADWIAEMEAKGLEDEVHELWDELMRLIAELPA
jgi:TRAP-type C4-dicarboxylate transport system substrate-binding protein